MSGRRSVAPTPLARSTWPRSPDRPSLRSMAALAMPRSARPSPTRGCGRSMARRTSSKASPRRWAWPRKASSARRASPSRPLTHSSSPGLPPPRRSACPGGTSPITVMQMLSGPAVVSPPTSSMPWASASAYRPSANPARKDSSTRGSDSASVKATGLAPQAARSDRFTASDLWPSASGGTVLRKWRPSTRASVDTAHCRPGVGCSRAQSSPPPRTACRTGRAKYFAIRSNSPTAIARIFTHEMRQASGMWTPDIDAAPPQGQSI